MKGTWALIWLTKRWKWVKLATHSSPSCLRKKSCSIPKKEKKINSKLLLLLITECLNNLQSGDKSTQTVWGISGRPPPPLVWLIQVDSLWCVFIKAFTEAQRRGSLKAHQSGLFYQPSGKCAEREGERGNSEEVSESNQAIVAIADPNTRITVAAAPHNKSSNLQSGALN